MSPSFDPNVCYQVDLRLPPALLGAVSDALFRAGAQAVTELVQGQRLEIGGPDRDVIEEAPVESTVVRGYFQGGDPKRWRRKARAVKDRWLKGEWASQDVVVIAIEEQDWSSTWKDGFKPEVISPHVLLKPTWEDAQPSPRQVVVEIDPGMAFGTGAHETTRGCLRLIDALLRGEGEGELASITPLPGPVRVLDVGCGTGILAIAALKLGAVEGRAVDIDPLAVEATRENARVNGVQELLLTDLTPVGALHGLYPLVVANILAGALVELAPELVSRASPGGALVLSGLLVEQAARVAQVYVEAGCALKLTLLDGDWACLLLEAPR